MATSIATPVKQQIAHYRLTPAIIGRELQKIFPGYDVRAFAIKVSTCLCILSSPNRFVLY
jgi:hypothetical protein